MTGGQARGERQFIVANNIIKSKAFKREGDFGDSLSPSMRVADLLNKETSMVSFFIRSMLQKVQCNQINIRTKVETVRQ